MFIEWTSSAFAQLEALPQALAFDIVSRVDLLSTFPEIGVSLRSRYPALQNCRQLIVKRNYRVIYEYLADAGALYVLAVQHCRQQLPSSGDLRRSLRAPDSED